MNFAPEQLIESVIAGQNNEIGSGFIPVAEKQDAVVAASRSLRGLSDEFGAIRLNCFVSERMDLIIKTDFSSGVIWFDNDDPFLKFVEMASGFAMSQNPDGDGFRLTLMFHDLWQRRHFAPPCQTDGVVDQ